MSDLSVVQTKQLNSYLAKHKGVSREKAMEVLFGGGALAAIREHV